GSRGERGRAAPASQRRLSARAGKGDGRFDGLVARSAGRAAALLASGQDQRQAEEDDRSDSNRQLVDAFSHCLKLEQVPGRNRLTCGQRVVDERWSVGSWASRAG